VTNRNNKTGFTLIELLVVIVIIMLLLSIMTPVFRAIKYDTEIVGCLKNMQKQWKIQLSYAENNGGIFALNVDWSGADYIGIPYMQLVNAGYLKNPSGNYSKAPFMQCPVMVGRGVWFDTPWSYGLLPYAWFAGWDIDWPSNSNSTVFIDEELRWPSTIMQCSSGKAVISHRLDYYTPVAPWGYQITVRGHKWFTYVDPPAGNYRAVTGYIGDADQPVAYADGSGQVHYNKKGQIKPRAFASAWPSVIYFY